MSEDGLLAPQKPRKAPKRGLRASINGKGKDCIYDPLSGGGTWRQQVSNCPSKDCPLYPVRPLSQDYKINQNPGGDSQ